MKANHKTLAREAALKILYKQEFHKNSETLNKNLSDLNKNIQDYVDNLLKGVQKNQIKIDELIQQTSKHWAFKRIALIDLNIMRIAIYEMLYSTPIVPFKICINEAIEIAKTYGTKDSPKFINGNLDTISKKLQT